jgi:hypothetical protein
MKGSRSNMPEQENKTSDVLQEEVLRAMNEFAKNNPELMEAMNVMNMSLADYLRAMECARGGQTVSYSSNLPLQA